MSAPVVDPTQPRFGCYVGNIDSSITLQMFREMFSACGTILDCSLNGNDEAPYRYGFIDFGTEEDRARALKYNGFTFATRKLKVSVSRGNVGKPDGYGSNSGNYGGPREDRERRGGRYEGAGGGGRGYNNNGGGGHGGADAATQLLLQLISQGAIDVRNLTPEQQQQVVAAAMGSSASATGAPSTPSPSMTPPAQPAGSMALPLPSAPQPQPQQPGVMMPQGMLGAQQQGYMMAAPPPQQAYMGPNMWMPQGPAPYGNMNMMMMPQGMMGRMAPNQYQAYQRPPANPMPTEETLKLRELQRKQYFDVVREQAEKYKSKYGDKASRKDDNGDAKDKKSDASSRSSSDDDDDEKK